MSSIAAVIPSVIASKTWSCESVQADLAYEEPPTARSAAGQLVKITERPRHSSAAWSRDGFQVWRHNPVLSQQAREMEDFPIADSAVTDQLHTSTLRPGTFEKCLRLFVTTIISWETACEAMRRSIFPIGLPDRSNSERIRA
jgi:hypothetical protein